MSQMETLNQTPELPLVYQTLTAPLPVANRPRSLSVIIPSYNQLATLLLCLKSLYKTAWQYGQQERLEIIVQDDCSPDFDAIKLLDGQPCKVERNEKNLGFSGNNNAGALRAKGDILLFLNQDTVARDGWFEPLVNMFDDPRVGIVGPKLVSTHVTGGAWDGNGKDLGLISADVIQSCGGLYDAGKGPFHRFLGYAADYWAANITERVSWTTGAALAISRELFYKLHGFDVSYERGYFEDVDLCVRVQLEKRPDNWQCLETWYCAESVFEHSAGSTGGIPAHIFKANSIRFHQKWDRYITPDINAIRVNY